VGAKRRPGTLCIPFDLLFLLSPNMSDNNDNNDSNPAMAAAAGADDDDNDDAALATLLGMGFDAPQATMALRLCSAGGLPPQHPLVMEQAVNYLLTGEPPVLVGASSAQQQQQQQQEEDGLYDKDGESEEDAGPAADFFLDGRIYHNTDHGGRLVIANLTGELFHFESTEPPPWIMFGNDDNATPPQESMRLTMKGFYPEGTPREFRVDLTWNTGTASGRVVDPRAKTTGDDPLSEEDAHKTISYHLQACEIQPPTGDSSPQEWIEFSGTFSGGGKVENMWFAAAGNYVSAKTAKDASASAASASAASASAASASAASASAASASGLYEKEDEDPHPPASAAAVAKRPIETNNRKRESDCGGEKRLKEAN
jgi:hypothetical protein